MLAPLVDGVGGRRVATLMKRYVLFLASFACLAPLAPLSAQDADLPAPRGPYLGQEPPGVLPRVFAPGVVSTDAAEGCSSFSGDGQLLLFARAGSDEDGILLMESVGGMWSKPRLAPFSSGGLDWDFMLAPDDETVFVSSGRPVARGSGSRCATMSIWTSAAGPAELVKPDPAPLPGEHRPARQLSVCRRRWHPLLLQHQGWRSRPRATSIGQIAVDGRYPAVENLGEPINSATTRLTLSLPPTRAT